jgi:hypothetical protein
VYGRSGDPGDDEYLLEPETAGNVTTFYLVLDEAGNFERAGQMTGASATRSTQREVFLWRVRSQERQTSIRPQARPN